MASLILRTRDAETGIEYESYYDLNQDNEEALERIEALLAGKNSDSVVVTEQLAHMAAESFKEEDHHSEEVEAARNTIRKAAPAYMRILKDCFSRSPRFKKLPAETAMA